VLRSGADGSYTYSGLTAGSYRVEFQTTDPNSVIPAVYYSNKLSLADSDVLTLTDLVVTPGIDAVLGSWGEIGGKATDASSVGIPGIQVSICDLSGLPIPGLPTAITQADGSYAVGGIPQATSAYTVRFHSNSSYAGQWYSNSALISSAIPVSVTATLRTSVDQVLPAVSVSGRVTDASGVPLSGIRVELFNSNFQIFPASGVSNTDFGVLTESDGTYSIGGIAPGNYIVAFQASGPYNKQYYNLKTTRPAPNVTVAANAPQTNINATLGTGVPVITGFSAPATSTTFTVSGITLTAYEPNGVTGYLLTESATPPTSATAGWSATAPTSYTFASSGTKTLYAWAKGTLGPVSGVVGVSASASQSLTVTVTPTLTVQLSGTGSGSVNSVPGGISCVSGSASGCSAPFSGLSASLTAAASGGSVFTGWTGICSGSGPTCSASFSADTTVSAIFDLAPVARIGTTGYPTLQAAYDAATTGQVIQLEEGALAGALTAAHSVNVIVAGGYLSDYSSQPGLTTLDGPILLRAGEVKLLKLKVK